MSDFPVASPSFFDRALRRITAAWREMAASVPEQEDNGFEGQIRSVIRARGGEVSARNRAADWRRHTWRRTRRAGRASTYSGEVRFRSGGGGGGVSRCRRPPIRRNGRTAKAALRRALEPPRLKLLTQFTIDPGWPQVPGRSARLPAEDARRGRALLDGAGRRSARICSRPGSTSAFWNCSGSTGTARPRCWKSWSPTRRCMPIRSWRDLKNRLDSDRRCYAFFHPAHARRAADLR